MIVIIILNCCVSKCHTLPVVGVIVLMDRCLAVVDGSILPAHGDIHGQHGAAIAHSFHVA